MEAKVTNLKFQVETARSIRVVDPTMDPTLVGRIEYNPDVGVFEYDSLDGDYLLHAQDLQAIADYISGLDVDNPRL